MIAAASPQRQPGAARGALPKLWWSIDPGQRHVGFAAWNGEHLTEAREVSPAEFRRILTERDPAPALVVIEAYSLLSPRYLRQQAAQAVDTIKMIGFVEAIAHVRGFRVVEQQPSVRHVAQRSPWWLETVRGVPANSHARSAVAHGVYFSRFRRR